MRRFVLAVLSGAAVLLFAVAAPSIAAQLNFKSGSAAIGQRDPYVSVHGAAVTVEGVYYQAASVAQQQALVINRYDVWCQQPANSQWVGVADGYQNSPPYGYIYSIQFTLPQAFNSISMSVQACADDRADLYLNGHQFGSGAHLESLTTFGCSNSAWFQPGVNQLDFYLQNNTFTGFNPGGLAFSGQVNYTPVPEPSSVLALLTGVSGLAAIRRRKPFSPR